MPITLQDVEQEIEAVFLLKDKGVVPIMLAAVAANLLGVSDRPVWLLLISGSSGGKSALLALLDGLKDLIVGIDTLTSNTFASSFKSFNEPSLLHKANNKVLVFKDFTTLLSMNRDGLRDIMGQMRAIYDGKFDKKSGNANDIAWVGKIGIIGGGTMEVQRRMREYSENGERFINYLIEQPAALEMTRRAVANQKDFKLKEKHLQEIVGAYLKQLINESGEINLTMPDDLREKMIQVSDFSTLARSPVITDFKTGEVVFVPDREMPARMATQFINMAIVFMLMNPERVLSSDHAKILYKCALDSIPVDRRMILRVLTEYSKASTKAIAIYLNYPTPTVRKWCTQLNALKMVERTAGDSSSDNWSLRPQYRTLMAEYEGTKAGFAELIASKDEERLLDNQEREAVDEKLLNKIYNEEAKQTETDWSGF